MPLLSVALITYNEEDNLARTLASVAWADQIIVVDSGSTDRTLEIARSFNATVLERPWSGFAAQKNFAIAQCTSDWILSLDADEELTPDLQQEIRQTIASQPSTDRLLPQTPQPVSRSLDQARRLLPRRQASPLSPRPPQRCIPQHRNSKSAPSTKPSPSTAPQAPSTPI